MQNNLNTSVQYLKGVGSKMSAKLSKLGIEKVEDLIIYYPRTYYDFSKPLLFKSTRIGDTAILRGKILSIENTYTKNRRMVLTKAVVGELNERDLETQTQFSAIWFNQPFLVNTLRPNNSEVIWNFLGKINFDFNSREKVLHSPIYEKNSKILPVYSETEGVTSKYLRKIITPLLDKNNFLLPDFLPNSILNNQKLMSLDDAIREIHFPTSQKKLSLARQRLSFDELFLIILNLMLTKKEINQNQAPSIKINKNVMMDFVKKLPYELTNAQRKASWEILNNMTKNVPMNRMLQGDVGSGKTVVVLMAALNAIKNNYKVLWMAPTTILAEQHFKIASNLLNKFDIRIGLITSNLKTANCQSEAKNCDLIIGTHALIQKDNKFKNVGLVIIDEQHRFGVKQRAELVLHGLLQNKLLPHFLSMTATPIPRTLALSIYSDLDISILDEKPKNRKSIITKLVDPTKRDLAYQFIRDQIKLGRQVFIICPLIEEEVNGKEKRVKNLLDVDRKSVKKEYDKLSKEIFPDLKIAMLHGKLPAQGGSASGGKSKAEIMESFAKGKFDILVSTSVIEVGVDVPNATIMMIEDADRFGLAQLHQFRGRVGRGDHQSYCLLFTSNLSPKTQNRLEKLCETDNGFKLAEYDLETRGPGAFFDEDQSGIIDLKLAKLSDTILIRQAREEVEKIVKDDIEKYPELLNKIREFRTIKHLE